MLTLFFDLGRLLSAFCVLAAFVVVSGRFFRILERSMVDFGGVKDAPGRVLEAPTAYFSTFFILSRARALAVRKSSRCAKTTVFPKFFLCFKHIAHVARKTKNSIISLLKPVEQSSPPKSCSKPVLERARLYLGGV